VLSFWSEARETLGSETARLHRDAFHPSQFRERIPQCRKQRLRKRIVLHAAHQYADQPHPIGLLRVRRQRPRCRAAKASNLRIEVRWCTDAVVCARYAADLVALGPKVLLAVSSPSLAALQQQTRMIPIVFGGVADPVGQGFVASLARPGGNITGFSVFDAPIAGKMLEMLTQITPPVERVAILFNPATAPYASLMLRAVEEAASSFAVAVQRAPVNSDAEVETMMAELSAKSAAACWFCQASSSSPIGRPLSP
jgi:hypothetical protein